MNNMPQETANLSHCDGFVANVHGPIDRMVSRYFYEDYRPQGIRDITTRFKRGSRIFNDTIALYGCYPDVQSLMQEGLAPPRPVPYNALFSFGNAPQSLGMSSKAIDGLDSTIHSTMNGTSMLSFPFCKPITSLFLSFAPSKWRRIGCKSIACWVMMTPILFREIALHYLTQRSMSV